MQLHLDRPTSIADALEYASGTVDENTQVDFTMDIAGDDQEENVVITDPKIALRYAEVLKVYFQNTHLPIQAAQLREMIDILGRHLSFES
jgi:hypothetical protein